MRQVVEARAGRHRGCRPPTAHGYFSLAANAEYAAALIGEMPFFVEVNPRLPRTFGEQSVARQPDLVGFCEADYAAGRAAGAPAGDRDRAIAALVAERIPDGATLQAGIGAVPDCVLGLLGDHQRAGRAHRVARRRRRSTWSRAAWSPAPRKAHPPQQDR